MRPLSLSLSSCSSSSVSLGGGGGDDVARVSWAHRNNLSRPPHAAASPLLDPSLHTYLPTYLRALPPRPCILYCAVPPPTLAWADTFTAVTVYQFKNAFELFNKR